MRAKRMIRRNLKKEIITITKAIKDVNRAKAPPRLILNDYRGGWRRGTLAASVTMSLSKVVKRIVNHCHFRSWPHSYQPPSLPIVNVTGLGGEWLSGTSNHTMVFTLPGAIASLHPDTGPSPARQSTITDKSSFTCSDVPWEPCSLRPIVFTGGVLPQTSSLHKKVPLKFFLCLKDCPKRRDGPRTTIVQFKNCQAFSIEKWLHKLPLSF